MQYVDALAHLLNTGQGVVLERSPYSDTVYLEAIFNAGYIRRKGRYQYDLFQVNQLNSTNYFNIFSVDKDAYYDWKEGAMTELMKPHLVIYLDVPASQVEDNLKKRGRGEEKVFNKGFLEQMEYNYKQEHLKKISEHAELLIYDWSSPGEAEIVVEDIERIDFDRFDKYDTKMEDWRLKEDWDWCEKRWK